MGHRLDSGELVGFRIPEGMPGTIRGDPCGGFRVQMVTETTKDDPAGHGSALYEYCIRVCMTVCDTNITS